MFYWQYQFKYIIDIPIRTNKVEILFVTNNAATSTGWSINWTAASGLYHLMIKKGHFVVLQAFHHHHQHPAVPPPAQPHLEATPILNAASLLSSGESPGLVAPLLMGIPGHGARQRLMRLAIQLPTVMVPFLLGAIAMHPAQLIKVWGLYCSFKWCLGENSFTLSYTLSKIFVFRIGTEEGGNRDKTSEKIKGPLKYCWLILPSQIYKTGQFFLPQIYPSYPWYFASMRGLKYQMTEEYNDWESHCTASKTCIP